MIVRLEGDALLLVTQPDHAALAGRVMERWRANGFPVRPTREIVLEATAEHDCGWIEEDAAPSLDPQTGRPYDFIRMPDDVKQAIWPRAIARHAERMPYVAALIAQHALTIYTTRRGDPAWHAFFDRMARERDRCLRRAPEGADDAFMRDYAIVFLGDLISLVFSNGWTEPFDAEDYRIILLGRRLQIAPDPFAGATVPMRARARRIPNRRYGSRAELLAAIEGAEECTLDGEAVGGASVSPRS
jgi:hypothetical protein